MSAAVFEERIDPGRFAAGFLAFLVHVLLIAVLVLGVRWQNKLPETVSVELWEPPQLVQPPKPVEPPKPEPRVETPPPPKPEPRIEKPDIVEKAPPPPKPKAEIKPAPKPEPKPAPLKPRVDESQKRMQEAALARELNSLAVDRERQQMKDQLAREVATSNSRARSKWEQAIAEFIRPRVRYFADDLAEKDLAVVVQVRLLPNCEVLKVTLRKGSGSKAYDDAVLEALREKNLRLPQPDSKDVFDPDLIFTISPKRR